MQVVLVFFFTVSNSQKSLVYHIHVRYITLLFFWNAGIFRQRQACAPWRNLELLGKEGRHEPSCLAGGRQVLSSGFGTVVLKASHIAWAAVLSMTCVRPQESFYTVCRCKITLPSRPRSTPVSAATALPSLGEKDFSCSSLVPSSFLTVSSLLMQNPALYFKTWS